LKRVLGFREALNPSCAAGCIWPVAPGAVVCYEARLPQVSAEATMTEPIDRAPFYHDGMRELQDRFDGRRVADGLEKHRLHFEFWEQDLKLIEQARFFFIATSYQDNVDCSMRSGDPGFVRITGPDTLEYPEYDGNNMYRTLGNIHRNPNVGLLFVRLDGKTFRTRIRGRATIHDSAETLAQHHGAKVVVRVKCEIFPNCPRYVPDLMAPEWKSRDYLKDVLSKHDPHRKPEA
jgi:hypothetical protein